MDPEDAGVTPFGSSLGYQSSIHSIDDETQTDYYLQGENEDNYGNNSSKKILNNYITGIIPLHHTSSSDVKNLVKIFEKCEKCKNTDEFLDSMKSITDSFSELSSSSSTSNEDRKNRPSEKYCNDVIKPYLKSYSSECKNLREDLIQTWNQEEYPDDQPDENLQDFFKEPFPEPDDNNLADVSLNGQAETRLKLHNLENNNATSSKITFYYSQSSHREIVNERSESNEYSLSNTPPYDKLHQSNEDLGSESSNYVKITPIKNNFPTSTQKLDQEQTLASKDLSPYVDLWPTPNKDAIDLVKCPRCETCKSSAEVKFDLINNKAFQNIIRVILDPNSVYPALNDLKEIRRIGQHCEKLETNPQKLCSVQNKTSTSFLINEYTDEKSSEAPRHSHCNQETEVCQRLVQKSLNANSKYTQTKYLTQSRGTSTKARRYVNFAKDASSGTSTLKHVRDFCSSIYEVGKDVATTVSNISNFHWNILAPYPNINLIEASTTTDNSESKSPIDKQNVSDNNQIEEIFTKSSFESINNLKAESKMDLFDKRKPTSTVNAQPDIAQTVDSSMKCIKGIESCDYISNLVDVNESSKNDEIVQPKPVPTPPAPAVSSLFISLKYKMIQMFTGAQNAVEESVSRTQTGITLTQLQNNASVESMFTEDVSQDPGI